MKKWRDCDKMKNKTYHTLRGGVMVSVLATNQVDRWFEPRSGQTKDYIELLFDCFFIFCFLLLR